MEQQKSDLNQTDEQVMQGSQMLPDISSGRDKIRRFDESPKLGPQNDQETMSVKESSAGGVAIPEATQSDLNLTN